jgi:L-histidine Nalpha-methyltransferase
LLRKETANRDVRFRELLPTGPFPSELAAIDLRAVTADVPSIRVLFPESERFESLRTDVRRGLSSKPKSVPPKWLYDARGSELFDEITRLPEYYLTRRERSILELHAPEIAEATGAETLIELGSGTSDKTRLLLDAFVDLGSLARFVAFDVSEATLCTSVERLAQEYPGLELHGVVGDFDRHLHSLPRYPARLIALLGSSIGNLGPRDRSVFLATLRAVLRPGEWLLLGIDLVKDPARIEAAYNDAYGVTAQFIKNLLCVLNRELGADFDLDAFAHSARWNPVDEWMELGLRSLANQHVHIDDLDLDVDFADGEELRSEISSKFRRDRFECELEDAGFAVRGWWTDPDRDFAVCLGERARA